MPFNKLEALSRKLPSLQRHLHKIMSREIVRDQGIMLLLGSMRAEERLAVFLLNLSQRFAARGLSPTQFQLRMSRQEIGSYLGLKLETVQPHVFRAFRIAALISVKARSGGIAEVARLACIGRQTAVRTWFAGLILFQHQMLRSSVPQSPLPHYSPITLWNHHGTQNILGRPAYSRFWFSWAHFSCRATRRQKRPAMAYRAPLPWPRPVSSA